MRNCMYCGAELDQGTIGPYCDPSHRWEQERSRRSLDLTKPLVDYSKWRPKLKTAIAVPDETGHL